MVFFFHWFFPGNMVQYTNKEGVAKTMNADTKLILNGLAEMRGDIAELREDVSVLRTDVNAINLKLENVIEPQIGFLADGHKDLMRKMNEVLEVHRDREMYIARLNKVEIDVDLLKEQMKHTA